MIKALVFDAYGTIFDIDSLAPVCEQSFPGRGPLVSQLWRTKQLEYTWLRTLMNQYEDFWRVTSEALVFACMSLDLPCDPPHNNPILDSYLRLPVYSEAREALASLASRPRLLLSNGTLEMLRAVVKGNNLEAVFADILSVDQVRFYKPDLRAYRLAADRLGLDAASIGFVSANSWDIAGAKAAGFRTCWVNRSGAPVDQLGSVPDITIRNLTDLVEQPF